MPYCLKCDLAVLPRIFTEVYINFVELERQPHTSDTVVLAQRSLSRAPLGMRDWDMRDGDHSVYLIRELPSSSVRVASQISAQTIVRQNWYNSYCRENRNLCSTSLARIKKKAARDDREDGRRFKADTNF